MSAHSNPPDLIGPKNVHRCVIEFADGVYALKLQHPEKCDPVTICGECGRHVDDSDVGPCDYCASSTGAKCWAEDWFANLTVGEMFVGKIEVAFVPEWLPVEETMFAHIVEAKVAREELCDVQAPRAGERG